MESCEVFVVVSGVVGLSSSGENTGTYKKSVITLI